MVEIKTENQDGVHIIHVDGDIDAGSSIHLDNALREAGENEVAKIAVDLTNLNYISSAGLGVFVSHLDEFDLKQIKLVIYGIQEAVKQVFDILGLEKIITIKEGREEAVEALNE